MSETKTNTTVEQVSIDELDNLLGMPGANVAMTGTDEPAPVEKPSFFGNEKVDMSILDDEDEPIQAEPKAEEAAPAKEAPAEEAVSFDQIIEEETDDEGNPKVGRPSLDKAGMAQLAQALIDDKVILPFEEDKKLEDYTLDDYKQLFAMNFQEKERRIQENTPKEFFESLPEELKAAAAYVAQGGTDMKGLFRTLAASEETKSLSIDDERGQEAIVKSYLQATNFGDANEIQEEIESWKDLDKLEAKAKQFKPKLDKMQEQVVNRQIKEQEYKRQQQEQASLQYAESIYNKLSEGELNGLKLDNKTQNFLYQGLIQPNYPSMSGQPTNLFGHLIEKHQFVEPNHGLIAEALWLLADPDGYKSQLKKGAKNEQAVETARQLKTAESSRTVASSGELETSKPASKRPALSRPTKDFFKR